MIVYRPHRWLLVDAIKEVKVFNTEEAMISYVKSNLDYFYHNIIVTIDEEELEDARIGWNHTRLVCIISDEIKYPMCVGMCDLVSFDGCSEEEIELMLQQWNNYKEEENA